MGKITFMGAGSTVFAKNVLGDVMLTPSLRDFEISLYDIDGERLEESYIMVCTLNKNINENRAKISKYLGVENRKEALKDADFVINAIQVGGYEPCTVTDFEIPKKYGLRQTIADTTGVGGVFRALRTIPIVKDFTDDMEEVCPNALFINYTNPMAPITGYINRFTNIKAVGLCHSVQYCARPLLDYLKIPYTEPILDRIAGINHMGWLLEVRDSDGTDLYPEIRRRAEEILNEEERNKYDYVRLEYIRRFGYYVTESSEHLSEYSDFFIKDKYPELIEKYKIPLDEYPRRCVDQIERWKSEKEHYLNGEATHTRTGEYASYIMEAMVTNVPYKIGGNVVNNGAIPNLPDEACVEVACLVDNQGIQPCRQPPLPTVLAALNMTEINVHLLTIEAALSKKKEDVYRAVMLDPHASSELSMDDIISMCDEMLEQHYKDGFMSKYN